MTERLVLNATGNVLPVYELVRNAGPEGVSRKAVRLAFPERPGKSMDTLLRRLLDHNAIALDPVRKVLLVNAHCQAPDLRGDESPHAMLLAALAEYPAGISTALLAEEVGMSVNGVHRHLGPFVERGRVRAITLPASHGGGDGYVLATAAEAAKGDGQFRLLSGGRFEMAWAGAHIVLPPDVTREMFRYLDELGGLHLSEQLAAPAAGA